MKSEADMGLTYTVTALRDNYYLRVTRLDKDGCYRVLFEVANDLGLSGRTRDTLHSGVFPDTPGTYTYNMPEGGKVVITRSKTP